jgi:2-methylisocitrate lyase-like PEP mutase family enzyme
MYYSGVTNMKKIRKTLRDDLENGPIVMAPGAYDSITARLVQKAGFPSIYMTGSGVSMSLLGIPDFGIISYAEVLDRVEQISGPIDLPLIVDGDTGYGGVLSVIRTVKGFETRGASAIQIEDQQEPKRCGHEFGRELISSQAMVDKIKAALDARDDSNFLIIARTDARTVEGMDRAIERALQYQEAGADVIFVESPESIEELQRIAASFSVPTMANMVEGGRTPFLSAQELQKLGFRLVIYPNSLTRLFCHAGAEMLKRLHETGSTVSYKKQMLTHDQLWDLFDAKAWERLEKRFVSSRFQ